MYKKEFEFLLKEGESEVVEFKPSLSQMDEIVQAVAGFANLKGGMIFVGISNKGEVLGCEIGKGTVENLANIINQNTEPKVHPEISIEKINDKKIIAVNIPEAIDKPVLAFGRLYKRIGKSTILCSRNEFEKLVLEKHKEKVLFDSQICEGANLKDIDKEKIKKFRDLYEEINKNSLKGSDKGLLKSLNCLKEVDGNIKITNAGILLFGKKPEKFFPMNSITIARYPGIKKGQEYLDIKDFYGSLFEIVDSANNYIKEHVQESSKVIEGKIAREVIPQYSYFAIRELITNAVVHRNYNIKGSRIIIRIYKDRIEFNSPGNLPANITPKNIVYEQYSRNPVIADVFSRVKFIEKMGEGWDKIIESVKEHPLKPKLPAIIDTGNSVVVTLFSPKEMVEKSKKDEPIMSQLNERQRKAVDYMVQNKELSRKVYCKEFNIKKTIAHEELTQLVNKGIFEKVGEGRATHYILNRTISGRLADDSENEKNKQKGKEVKNEQRN